MSSERVVRKRNIPSQAASPGIIKVTGSECGFLMSFERVVRKRNMPYESLGSEGIKIIRSRYGTMYYTVLYDTKLYYETT